MPPPSKKRKTNAAAPESISFDFAAREEYLTGFHKRKVARIKHAQEQSEKKEREDRLRSRAEMRKQRKEDLERHVSEVNRLVKQANGDLSGPENDDDAASSNPEDEAEGLGEETAPTEEILDQEDEYIDEDKYTTVTIETVGISKQGFEKKGRGEDEGAEGGEGEGEKKRVWTKEKPKSTRSKKKKIKFRYETKAERKAERVKQGIKKKKRREARQGD